MRVIDIMAKEVVTVGPEDSIVTAANLMFEHGYDGLPVIDKQSVLVGLVTQSNLVTKHSNIHLPTLLAFLRKFGFYRKESKFMRQELDNLLALKVKDVMNQEPPLLFEGESLDRALMHLSSTHGISPTSVVTQSRQLLGVVTRRDIFKLYAGQNLPSSRPDGNPKLVDDSINSFLDHFEKNYLFISRWRTRAWLTINILFLVTGVLVAAFFMLRLQVRFIP